MSYLTMILSCALLLGSTFAWYSDSVSSGVNLIQAKYPWMTAKYKESLAAEFRPVTTDSRFFQGRTTWAPGDQGYVIFQITNDGLMPMEFELTPMAQNITITKNAQGQDVSFTSVLSWGLAQTDTPPTQEFITTGIPVQTIAGTSAPSLTDTLAPGETTYVVFLVRYPSDHTDSLAPRTAISFGITLQAGNPSQK